MKKGEFDLTDKAIDCSGLPALGNAGKEIFRALKVACNGFDGPQYGRFEWISEWQYLALSNSVIYFGSYGRMKKIQPSDVLGQAAIDAAMDGATIVFEGDVIPANKCGIIYYYHDDSTTRWPRAQKEDLIIEAAEEGEHLIVAYKLLDEKPAIKKYAPTLDEEIQSRVLAEKVGFKELCPMCSSNDWAEREAETYDDLRDAHLEVINENLGLKSQVEGLEKEAKRLQRKLNDIRCNLDD